MKASQKERDCKVPELLFYITQVYLVVMLFGLPVLSGLGGYVTTGKDTFVFFTVASALYLRNL